MCNKVAYSTIEDAEAEIKQIQFDKKKWSKARKSNNSLKKDTMKLRIYRCCYCQHFHLTTQKQWK